MMTGKIVGGVALVLAAIGLVAIGARAITVERAAALREARERLSARVAGAAELLRVEAMLAVAHARTLPADVVIVSQGRVIQPSPPAPLVPLELIAGLDPEGQFFLDEARLAERESDGIARAIGLYQSAAGEDRDPVCVVLSRLRLSALLRRGGDEAAAHDLIVQLVGEMPRALALTRDGLMARALAALPADAKQLQVDLLRCRGSGDDELVLGMLNQAGLIDEKSVTAKTPAYVIDFEQFETVGVRAWKARGLEIARIERVQKVLDSIAVNAASARRIGREIMAIAEIENDAMASAAPIEAANENESEEVDRSAQSEPAPGGELNAGEQENLAMSATPAPRFAVVFVDMPQLPSGVVLSAAAPVDGGTDWVFESVSTAPELADAVVSGRVSRVEINSAATRRALWLAALLIVLICGGAMAALATLRALQREADAVRARAALLARVGHDLRTPLALVRMYGETLAAGKVSDPAQAREFAAIIARESERLSSEVATALDLTRLEECALAMRRLDLAALSTTVAEAHRPLLEGEGLKLTIAIDAGEHFVLGDEAALAGALGNILDNARRHGGAGGEVQVGVASRDGRCIVAVADRGAGIPPGFETQIFERYVRAPGAVGRGTGLGLALVREVVVACGGGVAARAREGGGAVIEFWLPAAPAGASETATGA